VKGVERLLQDYILYLHKQGKSKNTIISYSNDLNSFFHETNIKPDDYVIAADIRKWILAMLNPMVMKPLATSTINRRLNSLRSFYAWATKNKKLQHNPMQEIQELKSADEDSEMIMWLTEDDLKIYSI
jgi:site-specific recombinase XerD